VVMLTTSQSRFTSGGPADHGCRTRAAPPRVVTTEAVHRGHARAAGGSLPVQALLTSSDHRPLPFLAPAPTAVSSWAGRRGRESRPSAPGRGDHEPGGLTGK